jgi:hypothetical protein
MPWTPRMWNEPLTLSTITSFVIFYVLQQVVLFLTKRGGCWFWSCVI